MSENKKLPRDPWFSRRITGAAPLGEMNPEGVTTSGRAGGQLPTRGLRNARRARSIAMRFHGLPLAFALLLAAALCARADQDIVVPALLAGDDPLDPYDDPPSASSAFGSTSFDPVGPEDADVDAASEASLLDYDAVNERDESRTFDAAEAAVADAQAKRCGPGAKVSFPLYYLAGPDDVERQKRVEKTYKRAAKIVRVDPFDASDPKKAEVIWTFASLGKIPVSSTEVDPDVRLSLTERSGRLSSVAATVTQLRAVAAAYDAGEAHAVIVDADQPNDLERDWPGETLHDFADALPPDWKIVNLGAWFPEKAEVFDAQAKHSTDGGPDEVVPVSLGVQPVMAEWIKAWDRAGRPPAMPRPYKVSEDPRLWRVKGGVAAHTGAAAWLLNRDGMRLILQKYRREDGSFHLDDATCTEYEACVVGEAFKNVGGFYEATPPLFVPAADGKKTKRHDRTPKDVLVTFRRFVSEWLAFVNGDDDGFVRRRGATGRRDAAELGRSHERRHRHRHRHGHRHERDDDKDIDVDGTFARANDAQRDVERSIFAAVDSAANARAAGADEDGAIANVEYGFVDSSSEESEVSRRVRARDEAKKTLDQIAAGSKRASREIDWKKVTSGDYDDANASYEKAEEEPATKETVEEEDEDRPETGREDKTQTRHHREREHERKHRREREGERARPRASSEEKETDAMEALEAEELDPNAVRDADGFVCMGPSSSSSSSGTTRGSKGRGRDAAALGGAPGFAGGSRTRYTFEFFERLSERDAARRSPAVGWRRRWGSAAAAAPAAAAVIGVVATIAARRAGRAGDDEREERAPLVADDRV